jgi:photosystem II stability/assembly factor-like uncharacterized protein
MRPILLFALLAVAPASPAQVDDGGIDKSGGEEYQIAERERWFRQTRGLDLQADAAQLRATAVADLARISAIPMRGSGALWTPLGPNTQTMLSWSMGRVTGRAQALAVKPGDEDTLYLGTAAGGLWKTIDGGSNWTQLFDQIGTQTIGSVHIEPANPDRVWVGTGEDKASCSGYFGIGLYLSTDAGQHFVPRNGSGANTLPLSFISAVATKPDQPSTVFAGGTGFCTSSGSSQSGGLYRSLDGGASWTQVRSGALYDIVFDPSNANTVYAGFGGTDGIWKSIDGGANFSKLTNGISYTSGRRRLALAPSNPQVIYTIQGQNLHRSVDGGGSFELRNAAACEGQCTYNMAIDVHPTDPEQILVGTIRHARSLNGGTTLTPMTSGWGSGQAVHQDTHIVRYSRNNGGRLWIGTDGGLWRSDNGGSSYANLNGNIDSVLLYDVAVDPRDPTRIFGGAQDNSSSGRFSGPVWDVTRVTGDGMMNLVVPENPDIVIQAGYPNQTTNFPSLHRSLSGGTPNSLSTLPSTGLVSGGFPWVTPIAVSPAHHLLPATLFVASNRIWRGLAATASGSWVWTEVSNGALGSTVSVLESYLDSAGKIGLIAGASNGRVFRCADVYSTQGCTDITGSLPTGRAVTDVCVDRADVRRLFVTRSDFQGTRLYRSLDQGSTWTAVGAGLPNVPANSVAIAPRNRQMVLVATDIGVYASIDGGDSFVPFNDGMPLGNVVVDLEVVRARDVLVAASYGRGAWMLQLSDTLLVDGLE